MTDRVNTYVLENGPRNYVVRFTNESDGTGESAVTKVDISTLTGPDVNVAPTTLAIKEVQANVEGMNYVTVFYDATSDDEALVIPAGSYYKVFDPAFNDPKSTGYTGDIKLTTDGAIDGGAYDITIKFVKKQ